MSAPGSRRFERLPGTPPRYLVHGVTPGELFEHAAEAMFATSYDIGSIPSTYSRPIVAPGDSYEELLLNWLDELRFVSAREGFVWSWFVVDRLEEGGVQGSAGGLPIAEVGLAPLIVTGASIRSNGIVPIPAGVWVELEFELGPPVMSVG